MNAVKPNDFAINRRFQRTTVAIDIFLAGVLESHHASIADLSEGGAMIVGASLPQRARCELHFAGQTVYGIVMWSEIDRIGVRFPYELNDGPLYEALMAARHQTGSRLGLRLGLAPHRAPAGFGRRGL